MTKTNALNETNLSYYDDDDDDTLMFDSDEEYYNKMTAKTKLTNKEKLNKNHKVKDTPKINKKDDLKKSTENLQNFQKTTNEINEINGIHEETNKSSSSPSPLPTTMTKKPMTDMTKNTTTHQTNTITAEELIVQAEELHKEYLEKLKHSTNTTDSTNTKLSNESTLNNHNSNTSVNTNITHTTLTTTTTNNNNEKNDNDKIKSDTVDSNTNNDENIKSKTIQLPDSERTWYQNIPDTTQIDDTILNKAFKRIFQDIANDYRTLNINVIVERFIPIMSEFYELSAPYRAGKPKYNGIFEKFLSTLCKIYDMERQPMVVYSGKYSPREWGNVYWSFLHLSSILLSYAFEKDKIDTLLDFPTLVYNIDYILPCNICAYHYGQIKNNDEVRQVIKTMSFGSVMIGLQIFHNIITQNVDHTPEYSNMPKRDRFMISDYALHYKCIDVQRENLKYTLDYMKSCIDWQPTAHVYLAIVLSTYCEQPSYDRASNLLKYKLYAKREEFNGIDLTVRHADIRVLDNSDLMYISLSDKQIMYCLMRALLLQFQDTRLKPEDLHNNKRFTYAVINLYQMFNAEIKELVRNYLKEPHEIEQRDELLLKLEKVQAMTLNI